MRRVALTILVCLCIGCSSSRPSSSSTATVTGTEPETRRDPTSEFCNKNAGPANTHSLSSLLELTQVLVTSSSATRDNDLTLPGSGAISSTTAADVVGGPIVFEHWHVTVDSVLLSDPNPAIDAPSVRPGAELGVVLPFHNPDNTSVLAADGSARLIGLQYLPDIYRALPVRWQVMFTATATASGGVQFDCEGGKGYSEAWAAFAAARRATSGPALLVETLKSARQAQSGGPVDADLQLLMTLDHQQASETATSSTTQAAATTP